MIVRQSSRLWQSVAGMLLLVPALARAQWTPLASGTTASLRGLSVVDAQVVWASGSRGAVVRTTDGGATWHTASIPGAESFDLRSIWAMDARAAVVAATAGRIWRTTDGGRSWQLVWQSSDTAVFLDAVAFADARNGLVLGDPIGGRWLLLRTTDGGASWRDVPLDRRPEALPGEAAFAASGSSLIPAGRSYWLGSGGRAARLYRSDARGERWRVWDSPVAPRASTQGIFSVTTDGQRVFSVGGDYQTGDSLPGTAMIFLPRDERWQRDGVGPPRGFRSAVAVVARPGAPPLLLAVGPGGSDQSQDGGVSWDEFDRAGYHAVRVSPDGVFYASGSDGRIAKYIAPTHR